MCIYISVTVIYNYMDIFMELFRDWQALQHKGWKFTVGIHGIHKEWLESLKDRKAGTHLRVNIDMKHKASIKK